MRTILDKAKIILSDKKLTIAILIFAIASRMLQTVFFYNIIVDGSYQYMAMQNFVYGHGITIASVSPGDLSQIHYTPLINWPPGYSLLLAPFYFLFSPNYIAAGLALDFCAILMLVFSSRAILNLFNTPTYLTNIFTLLVGSYIYYFYFIESSDSVAIAFYTAALYYSLSLLKTKKHWQKKIVFIAMLLVICGSIKYLFIPLVFVIPVLLIIEGFFSKEKILKQAGILCFSILFFAIATLLIYQKLIGGSATYISQPERGFFPKHLLDAYPLIPASLLSNSTLSLLTGNSNLVLRFYQVLYALSFLFCVNALFLKFIKSLSRTKSLKENYVFLLFFISITIIVLLAILSLSVAKEEIMPGRFWTYIEEPRYYGLSVIMIQMGIFILYPWQPASGKNRKYLFWFLIVLILPEMGRGLFFDINRIRLAKKEEYSWQAEDRFQKYADRILKSAQLKYSPAQEVVTGSSYYLNHRVSLYSRIPVLANASSFNLSTLQTSKPVVLLIIVQKTDHSAFQSFLSTQKEIAGEFDDFYFYTVYVQPH